MKTRDIRRSWLCVLFCVIIFFVFMPAISWGFLDFTKPIGFDADSMGRGGTSIAIPDDPSNMNMNPALISAINGNALEANLLLIHPDLDFKYTGTGGAKFTSTDKDRLLVGPGISFARHSKDSPFAWGLTASRPRRCGH